MGEPKLKVPPFWQLAEANLRAQVSRPLTLKSVALFSCKRVFERPVRNHSQPPTTLSTTSVTGAPFPLHFRKMRAQSAVRDVRYKRMTKPEGLAASSKLYLALDSYMYDDTRPNLEEIRQYQAEI